MKCLVLRDLVGMVDFAMVDAAGVDVERMAQPRLAHHRAFEVPARRALAPGGVPFHLPLLARRGLAPYGEVAGVSLARDRTDAGMSPVVSPPGKPPLIRHHASAQKNPP